MNRPILRADYDAARPQHAATQRARIEAALRKVAEMMVTHDKPHHAPILRRLQAEMNALEDQDSAMAEARALLGQPRKERSDENE